MAFSFLQTIMSLSMARFINPDVRYLRYVIANSGMPMYAIAKAVGISAATLSNLSNGVSRPSGAVRNRLSTYFGTSADVLFNPLCDALPWLSNGVTFD